MMKAPETFAGPHGRRVACVNASSGARALRVASDLQSRTADELMRKNTPSGVGALSVTSGLCGVARSTRYCAEERIDVA